jgi:hypothetical protein
MIGERHVRETQQTLLILAAEVGYLRGCTQKFPDWPPGARTTNGAAFCY